MRLGNFTSGGYPKRHYKALEREYDKSGVPWLYWEEPATESLIQARKELRAGDCMLILLGPRGTGKTQAAVEMALDLDCHMNSIDRGVSHMYATLSELFNNEKASWNDSNKASPIKKAKNADLLVLDEIQEVVASDWERQALTLLVDERYRDMKRTVMIGNLTKDGLNEFFSKSISSRLKETGTIIEMAGKRYR